MFFKGWPQSELFYFLQYFYSTYKYTNNFSSFTGICTRCLCTVGYEADVITIRPQCHPTFLITLLTIVLTWNKFEFRLRTFIQLIGTAMGTYAKIFMKKIDIMLQKIAGKWKKNLIRFYKRFIHDIFIIWQGTEEFISVKRRYIEL